MASVPSRAQVEDAFKNMDRSGDKCVHVNELRTYLQENFGCRTAQIAEIFADIDADGDNLISFEEFSEQMLKEPRSKAIKAAFSSLDKDGSQTISPEECMDGGGKAGLTDIAVLQKCYAAMDKNGDNNVSICEFMEYMDANY